MGRKASQHAHEPGQDSFLDIVANLVGILIILVMVVGARAKDAMLRGDASPTATPQTASDLRSTKHAEVSVRDELESSVDKVQ